MMIVSHIEVCDGVQSGRGAPLGPWDDGHFWSLSRIGLGGDERPMGLAAGTHRDHAPDGRARCVEH